MDVEDFKQWKWSRTLCTRCDLVWTLTLTNSKPQDGRRWRGGSGRRSTRQRWHGGGGATEPQDAATFTLSAAYDVDEHHECGGEGGETSQANQHHRVRSVRVDVGVCVLVMEDRKLRVHILRHFCELSNHVEE